MMAKCPLKEFIEGNYRNISSQLCHTESLETLLCPNELDSASRQDTEKVKIVFNIK